METKKHILLIEDDVLVKKSLSRLLEQAGYQVSEAGNCEEAVQQIENNDIDLIISDIRMPGIDGVETIQTIRSTLQKNSKSPIPEIFITGYAEGNSHQKAQELHVADFIYKPFEKEYFLQTISKILN